MKIMLFFNILFVLLSVCSDGYANEQEKNRSVKYVLHDFDTDLTQLTNKVMPGYMGKAKMRSLIHEQLKKFMQEKNLLADESDPQAMGLDIFVDYRRRFNGDQTPFPSSSIASPNLRVFTKVFVADYIVREEYTPELTSNTLHFGGANAKAYEKDRQHMIAVAKWIVDELSKKQASDAETFFMHVNKINTDLASAKYLMSQSERRIRDEGLYDESLGLEQDDYIPKLVADEYLKRLNVEKSKGRIKVYKEISNAWLNSLTLFDAINDEVLQRSLNASSKEAKELDWAMRALSSSGHEKYKITLDKIKDNAKDKKIKKSAEKAIENFMQRQGLSQLVHNVARMSKQRNWQENQLSNMIHSSDLELRMYAVQDVYRNHTNNHYLTNLLAEILETESMSPHYFNRYRFSGQVNFYAWITRVLALSKRPEYKSLLMKVSEEAFSEKVREYAKKFMNEI